MNPCAHGSVALLSATIVERTPATWFLMESGVCKDCAATVSRKTVIRQKAWAIAPAAAPPAEALYLCVPAPAMPGPVRVSKRPPRAVSA